MNIDFSYLRILSESEFLYDHGILNWKNPKLKEILKWPWYPLLKKSQVWPKILDDRGILNEKFQNYQNCKMYPRKNPELKNPEFDKNFSMTIVSLKIFLCKIKNMRFSITMKYCKTTFSCFIPLRTFVITMVKQCSEKHIFQFHSYSLSDTSYNLL